MKKIKLFPSIFSIAIFFTLLVTACNKQDSYEITAAKEPATSFYKTVDDIKALEIDATFNLSADVYSNFLNSIEFKDKQLRGFYYAGVVKNMSIQQQEKFWAYFDISVQLSAEVDYESRETPNEKQLPLISNEFCIADNATPLYCRPFSGWVCMYNC